METERPLITTPVTAELLRGATDVEETELGVRPHRLPAWARAQNNDANLAMNEAQPAGVRLALRTRATTIELDALPTKRIYVGAPPRPEGVYELLVDGLRIGQGGIPGGHTHTINIATWESTVDRSGEPGTVRFAGLSGEAKHVEIWLPHNENTELIRLRTDAPVEPAPESGRRVWLHHGSSISHGSDAVAPTRTWPVVAASLSDMDLINLGFGGNAVLDPFTARTMRDIPADVISVKLGINVVNGDLMRLRVFGPAVHGFLDTIREGQPTTPLVVVSPLMCPIQEDTPGPGGWDPSSLDSDQLRFQANGDPADRANGKLTLNIIRDELSRIVAQRAETDPNLHYLDGRELYGEAECAELPMPDRLHPDPAGHRRIGEQFAELVFAAGGVLGGNAP